MSHAARSLELVDGLISSVLGRPSTQAQRNSVLKRLRDHTYARANQFAVQAKVDGLVEKFGILCRDDLAAALETRIQVLPTDDKFLPDKLALLLELSDVPHLKVDADAIIDLDKNDTESTSDLRWSDIVRDDPLDGDIWNNIERGYHSSGDEDKSEDGRSGRTPATSISSTQEDVEALARSHLKPPLSEALSTIDHRFTELKVVRETLSMLRGLSTDTYVVDHRNGSVYSSTLASLHKVTRRTTQELIDSIAQVGSALNFLRGWCRQSLTAQHLRTCQAAIQTLLDDFDSYAAAQDCPLVQRRSTTVVSMLRLCAEVEGHTRPMIIVARTIRHSTESSFLDNLYVAVCEQHSIGDQAAFNVLHRVLLVTLVTFLRPAVRWACSGLVDALQYNPLVEEHNEHCALSRAWQDRFAIKNNGSMPAFLDCIKQELFDLGKSRMMLTLLGEQVMQYPTRQLADDDTPAAGSMISFQEHFHGVLMDFISTLRPAPEDSLVDTLRTNHGIIEYLDALEGLYLLRDASSYQALIEAMHQQAGRSAHVWPSDWLLTELARESVQGQSAETLAGIAVTTAASSGSNWIRRIGLMKVKHTAPWFIANIFSNDGSLAHQAVFSLLLQLGFAKQVLQAFVLSQRRRSGRLTSHAASFYSLARRLIVIIDTFRSHITAMGAELSQVLRSRLQDAITFDDMLEAYQDFSNELGFLTITSNTMNEKREHLNQLLDLADTEYVAWPRAGTMDGTAASSSLASAWQTLQSSLNALTITPSSNQWHSERLDDLLSCLRDCQPRVAVDGGK